MEENKTSGFSYTRGAMSRTGIASRQELAGVMRAMLGHRTVLAQSAARHLAIGLHRREDEPRHRQTEKHQQRKQYPN
jgi:hypothetical protein